jgi:hypothetical protein
MPRSGASAPAPKSTTRPHHQARQFSVAFLAGRSRPSGSALRCGLETTVHAPSDAPATEHCQGGHGPKTGTAVVLNMAEGLAVFNVFASILSENFNTPSMTSPSPLGACQPGWSLLCHPDPLSRACIDTAHREPVCKARAKIRASGEPKGMVQLVCFLRIESGAPKATILELFSTILWHVCDSLAPMLDCTYCIIWLPSSQRCGVVFPWASELSGPRYGSYWK